MTVVSKANQQIGALWNRQLTLRLLREHKTLSRQHLAEMTGLRGSTLSYIVRELLRKRVVRTAGKLPSRTVGQKQVLLEINPRWGWGLGVELGYRSARTMMIDASGQVLDATSLPIEGPLDRIVSQLHEGLHQRMAQIPTPPGQFLGLAVGVPGIVDHERGVVLKSQRFAAVDVPLGQMLADQFGAAAMVEHDVNLAALAEAREGAARGLNHYIHYLVNHERSGETVMIRAFGASLFLAGRLYRGVHFAAGEMDPGLAPPEMTLTVEELEKLGDPEAAMTQGMATLARELGRSVAHLVNFVDPEATVLGGNQPLCCQAFLEAVRESAAARLIPVHGRTVEIRASTLGQSATARGAAIAAVEAALLNQDETPGFAQTGVGTSQPAMGMSFV